LAVGAGLVINGVSGTYYGVYLVADKPTNDSATLRLLVKGVATGETVAASSRLLPSGQPGIRGVNGFGFEFAFDVTTTAGASAGGLRLNNADITLATEMYVSETDAHGLDLSIIMGQIEQTSLLAFRSIDDPNEYAFFQVSGPLVDNGADRTIPITYLVHTGAFLDLENVLVIPTLRGPQGLQGDQGIQGETGEAGVTAFGLDFVFEAVTTAPPSAGSLRVNNADHSLATEIYVAETDATFMDEFLVVSNYIQVVKSNDSAIYSTFQITSVTDNGTSRTISVTPKGSAGTLVASDSVRLLVAVSGDTGPTGESGTNGVSGFGLDYTFDSATTAGSLTGELRFNNADPSLAQAVYVHETEANGVTVDAVLDVIAVGSPLQIFKANDPTTFALFEITAISDNGSDRTYTVTALANNGTFADTDAVRLAFSAKGSTGAVSSATSIKLTHQPSPPTTSTGETAFYADTNGLPTFRQESDGAVRTLAYLEFDITTSAATSYTLQLSDRFGKKNFTAASTVTVTVPLNSSVAFPTGSAIILEKSGNGNVEIAAAGGVTIKAAGGRDRITEQYGTATLIYEGSDTWSLAGNLVP